MAWLPRPFPWAPAPPPSAKIMRNLGELIAQHVPQIARTETQGHRARSIARRANSWCPARPTTSTTLPRCARDGHTYPTPTHLNYTLFHPVGVGALIIRGTCRSMTSTWKVAPCLAFGNTVVLENERTRAR